MRVLPQAAPESILVLCLRSEDTALSQTVEMLDVVFGALCACRENRGAGRAGMQSVLNVLANRAAKNHTSIWEETLKPLQFSSMTAPHDPQLNKYWLPNDPEWALYSLALNLAIGAAEGSLNDLTNGSTLYYAPTAIQSAKTYTLPDGRVVPFPEGWNEAVVTFQVEIGNQLFFTE